MNELAIPENGLDIRDRSEQWNLIQHYIAPIAPFFRDPSITSIAVNRFDNIFVRRNGEWVLTDAKFQSENDLRACIEQVVRKLGQTIEATHAPIADARLEDGSRVNAVLYPTAHFGSNMTIRLFPKVRYGVADLLSKGSFNEDMMRFLKLSVLCRSNTLVSGATGSGKTTILNALGNLIGDRERIGIIEDTAELKIDKTNAISEEAPKRSIKRPDGKDFVTMESLLVNTLRQELSTVIVGEVREPLAATALMLALNTGHEGTLSTLHANNPKMALRRIINMLLSNDTRMPYDAVASEIHDNFNLVVQAERTPRDGQRIVDISEVGENGTVRPLYKWDYLAREHVRVFDEKAPPLLFLKAEKYGFDLNNIELN
jgi:pilus assembly protein CpaF